MAQVKKFNHFILVVTETSVARIILSSLPTTPIWHSTSTYISILDTFPSRPEAHSSTTANVRGANIDLAVSNGQHLVV